MNQDQFQKFIEQTRDCDGPSLDAAVRKGVLRARREVWDFRKMVNLGIGAATAAMLCFASTLEPVTTAALNGLADHSFVTESGAEIVQGHFVDLMNAIMGMAAHAGS